MTPAAVYWLRSNRLYLHVTPRLAAAKPGGAPPLTLLRARGPGLRVPGLTVDVPRDAAREPSAEELARAVEDAYARDDRKVKLAGLGMGESDEGVVFAGTGEPLLRADVVCEAARLVKEARHGVPLCVNTLGLGVPGAPEDVARALAEAGVDTVSQFFPSADPAAFSRDTNGFALGAACAFASACVEAGLALRGVTVARGGVSTYAVRALATSLGASDFEVKRWLP